MRVRVTFIDWVVEPEVAFTVNWVVVGVVGALGVVAAAAGELLEHPITPKLAIAAAAMSNAPLSKARRRRMLANPRRLSGARNARA